MASMPDDSKTQLDDGWLPISSAPKDGTWVDLYYEEFGRIPNARYQTELMFGWVTTEGHPTLTVTRPNASPTHWRPLPTPPRSSFPTLTNNAAACAALDAALRPVPTPTTPELGDDQLPVGPERASIVPEELRKLSETATHGRWTPSASDAAPILGISTNPVGQSPDWIMSCAFSDRSHEHDRFCSGSRQLRPLASRQALTPPPPAMGADDVPPASLRD